ncbi:MAG: NADP-dependent oxidoreductase [Alphaproteobacteria bacterium]|nr:NADP-dependent oxidoreductase [Alphaproteobacteria bacterium]
MRNRQIILKAYPVGMPKASDFELVERDVPKPGPGQVLVRTIYMSLDPYMRGRMNNNRRSYAEPIKLGEVCQGGTVGQVVASNDPDFKEGDFVADFGGWQEYSISAKGFLRKLDPDLAPISTAQGVLGMPGHTAYAGVIGLSKLKAGETLFVSAASGAVGGVVGQIARIKGARAVGVAGTDEKCAFVRKELRFDACFNHKGDLAAGFKEHCPKGVDVNFENVGGEVFWNAFSRMNLHGRIIICGFISAYNDTDLPPGPDRSGMILGGALVNRLTIHGLLVSDWMHLWADFQRDVSGWIRSGELRYREDIVKGLENAVPAFQGLLQGKNFGKLLVQLSDDPTR